jgi:hypothetical protein
MELVLQALDSNSRYHFIKLPATADYIYKAGYN